MGAYASFIGREYVRLFLTPTCPKCGDKLDEQNVQLRRPIRAGVDEIACSRCAA